MKTAVSHRILLPITVAVILVDLVLLRMEVITWSVAVALFFGMELPLGLFVLFLVFRQVRQGRVDGHGWRRIGDEVGGSNPMIRLVVSELVTLHSAWLLIRRRRHGVGADVRGFGYVKGSMTVPMLLVVAVLIEAALMHFLIPWAWLSAVLLLLSVYTLVLIFGLIARQIVHPHLLDSRTLTLRSGDHVVACVDVSLIGEVTSLKRAQHTWVAEEDGHLHLASSEGSNLDIRLTQPVEAVLPAYFARNCRRVVADRLSLYLEDPTALRQALAEPATAE
ncbi:hypothetical protein [Rhizohabitans arisaemae]|uniref:hypothetical protein n=1 Tax=Rhizohabitans arisaemae TaxID=2720610 RepID=UPI0024B1D757|nr:hypothetical protein [Rhizohabitans arisaemae]